MRSVTPEDIDKLLPQTQCGLCGYGGCLPYAEAIMFEQAPINLCPPGGVKTLVALGELLQQDASPFIAEMDEKARPKMIAVVREAECIGCTKCIQACPVDAILGSAKQMHAVIADECTGCELCVTPCPVDCIDMLIVSNPPKEEVEQKKKNLARKRFNARNERLQKEKKAKDKLDFKTLQKRKSYIEDALARVQAKKVKT